MTRRSRCRKSWRRPAAGLTLVEVIGALAILGGVLVAVLLVRANAATQRQRAALRQIACQRADELLGRWMTEGSIPGDAEGMLDGGADGVPDGAENVLDGAKNVLDGAKNVLDGADNVLGRAKKLRWRTRELSGSDAALSRLGGRVIRLEIFGPEDQTLSRRPLVTVDVVAGGLDAQGSDRPDAD